MDEQLIYRHSRTKVIKLLLGCILIFTLSWLFIPQNPAIGWLGVTFFGLGIPAFLLALRPNAIYLRLDREGFELVGLLRSSKYKWSDVNSLKLGTLRDNPTIMVSYNEHHVMTQGKRSMSVALIGCDFYILNQYIKPIDEICQTMNSWRERFGRQAI